MADHEEDGGQGARARVVCNPRGYRDRRTGVPENPLFEWNKVIEL
jgi:hypothetical protein